jgi:hypothetical protein
MIGKILTAVLLLLIASPIIHAKDKLHLKQRIIGVVVANDGGLELADGSCRQNAVVRVKSHSKRKQSNEYVLIRYQSGCAVLLPNEILEGKGQWQFSVTRQMNCDQRLEELKYLMQMSPDGTVYRLPLLKLVAGKESEKIPTDVKLPCYVLLPGDFKLG